MVFGKEQDCLTGPEMEVVTVVFHQFETGLREGTIYTRDILDALKALGLNPGEQEVIDMTNEVSNNGLVYFPDFCKLVLRKYREENQELFYQHLFKIFCGTNPYPKTLRAKRYKLQEKSFTKEEFSSVMRQLPVPVDEEDIEGMFSYADKDKDGRISYSEFLLMITPAKTPTTKSILKNSGSRYAPAQRKEKPVEIKEIKEIKEAVVETEKNIDIKAVTETDAEILKEKSTEQKVENPRDDTEEVKKDNITQPAAV